MKDKVKEFIKQNLDLIDNQEWDKFYEKVQNDSGWETSTFDSEESIGELTEFIISCGAEPLLYLKEVPECYLYGCKTVETIELPENITRVGPMAFMYMPNLKTITFHKNIETLYYRCIGYCDSLESVTIESNDCLFDNNVFNMSPNIKHVTYGGTVLDWRQHNVRLYDCTVDCTDGKVKYNKQGDFI